MIDNNNFRKLFLIIMKLVMIFNAERLGWDIRHVQSNKITIAKKLTDMNEFDHNTANFLTTIMTLN